MNDIDIIERDAQITSARNNLKKFSESIPNKDNFQFNYVSVKANNPVLKMLDYNHKVNGNEFNDLVEDVQDMTVSFLDLHTKTINQFDEIYKALGALDKEYIEAIMYSMDTTKRVNDKVKVNQKAILQGNEDMNKYHKKLIISYIIAGSSFVIAVLSIALNFFGVV